VIKESLVSLQFSSCPSRAPKLTSVPYGGGMLYSLWIMLRGGDHLYRSVLWIIDTIAMPCWITGEAAGWWVFPSILPALGSQTNLTRSLWSSSYTPSNREMLPHNKLDRVEVLKRQARPWYRLVLPRFCTRGYHTIASRPLLHYLSQWAVRPMLEGLHSLGAMGDCPSPVYAWWLY